ncbi:MAG TPA: GNAT family N-acetyltransferase, partial [Puia sp.]|nr:GNAT family N-acetyltransferase [Puia sp.]
SCVNYEILMSKDRKNCMCTAMLYDPKDHYEPEETTQDFRKHSKLYERFMRIKQWKLLKPFRKLNGDNARGSGGGSTPGGRSRSLFHTFFHF